VATRLQVTTVLPVTHWANLASVPCREGMELAAKTGNGHATYATARTKWSIPQNGVLRNYDSKFPKMPDFRGIKVLEKAADASA
jgi:hypothetical protein